jgi:hypothetical protein
MDHQRIILEASFGFVLLCLLAGFGYAFLLYRTKHPWSILINRVLFALRAILAFFLSFLLLGPIVKQLNNVTEKPLFVILQDNSGSVKETVDSATLQQVQRNLDVLRGSLESHGYDVTMNNLDGDETTAPVYNEPTTDLQRALQTVRNRYEGKKFGGVLLVSDGIYNTGISPLFTSYNFPVNTLGIGDTTQRMDISIRNIAYNKIAYQGNQFPVRVEVVLKGLTGQRLRVTLQHKGRIVDTQTKESGMESFLTFDFKPLADEKGIQKYDVQVEVKPEEFNKRNNHASIFVEVVEGKKKILLVAPSPHPDIKAIRAVVEKNSNYELKLFIPGITDQTPGNVSPTDVDLVIFHQAPDKQGKTRNIFDNFMKSRTPAFFILGRQSDLAVLSSHQDIPLKIDGLPRDYDDVTPVVNPGFTNFTISTEANSVVSDYPPVSVPFGKIQLPLSVNSLLFQRIGSVVTDKPLLAIDVSQGRKVAIMLGEGLWRWRLDEFEQTDHADAFDEIFGKLIQYLSTSDEKRKFRSYPIQQEFSDVESVIFESQVYNDIFEPVYGNTINIELTDDLGKISRYAYITSPGNIRYQIGGLHEGVYRYKSTTTIEGRQEEIQGQFAVVTKVIELQNLTADFDLLRKLSLNTGGRFYALGSMDKLNAELSEKEASGVIRSEETYDALINLKFIFWILLGMISVEWFLRKYYGSY